MLDIGGHTMIVVVEGIPAHSEAAAAGLRAPLASVSPPKVASHNKIARNVVVSQRRRSILVVCCSML